MLKRNVAIFVAIIFVITMLPLSIVQGAYAYTSNAYFNDLKIGLVSMSATTNTITLNGDYTINGQVYPSGSVFNLGISGTSITFNGTLQNQISLIPKDKANNLLTLTSGSVSNKYMGSFLFKIYNSKVLAINTLDMENYLKGVVGYEMSDSFPVEALKTQAVAARNYALSRIGYEAAKGYDFDDTINYQVYKGYNPSYTRVLSAVDQTKGQVLLYSDKLVETLYSAWHGGVSEDSENVWGNYVPYLRSVQDSYESDPWPNGNRVLTNSQIQSTLVSKGYLLSTDTFTKLDLGSITNFPSGRVANINIIYKDSTGLVKSKSVTKDSTRTFLSLPSNLYTVTYDSVNGAYTFVGKGNGHGLGMSQIGAKNRAAAGQTFDQILKFYYQNTYLQNVIQKASLSGFTQSTNTLLAGNTISFNMTAAGGNGFGYLYKFVVKNGANTVLTNDYTTSSALDFVPSSGGSYTVEAYVKDKYSISDYDDKTVGSFTAYDNPTLNNFTLNKISTLTNQPVAASTEVQSGSGSYLYKYEVSKDGTILTTRDFASDKQYSYTPVASGSYTITSYIKDSLSTKNYDLVSSQSFNAYDAPSITSLTKDVSNVFVGDTVNFTAAAAGGSNSGITYKYVVSNNGQTIATRDFNSNNTFSYVPSAQGSYEVDVYALDAVSSNQYDAVSSMNFAVNTRPSINSLTVDKSTIFVNDTVNVNSASTSSNALYKFVVSKNNAVVGTQDYSASSALGFIPLNDGNYTTAVYAKDILSTQDYDDVKSISFSVLVGASLNSVQTNKTEYLVGQTMNLNAAAANGTGSYLYKYVIAKDGVSLSTVDFNNLSTLQYVINASGNYTITVYMKDAASSKAYDDMKTVNVKVDDQPSMNFTGSQTSSILGSTINYGISEINGSGKAQYRFLVTNGSNTVVDSGYTDANTFSFSPSASGSYSITGYIKDALSENTLDAQNSLNLNVYSPQISTAAVTGSFYEGRALTINANGSGASSSGLSYKYEVYNNGNIIASNSFNSSNVFTFTPAVAGSYTVKIYGKDAISSNTYDCIKQFTVTINAKPLYLSILPLSYGMTNNDVISLQNALIKLSYPITSATGYFGAQTKSSVISFQTSKGLTADGVVGNATYGALNSALIDKTGTSTITY